jgi:poly-gamma-glutamate capsule biosynthesis protein CapA/YwtB (metallophosphatase superfamily)
MKRQTQPITLYAAGEVLVNRDNPESIMELVAPVFTKADVKFCQLETVISERGVMSAEPINPRSHPRNIRALKAVGFDVACFASNHSMDWGNDGLYDTIELLERDGIHVFGAGANLAAACKPAFVERNGTKIAFLGYNCNLPQDYWAATDKRPGCAALRVLTFYEMIERIHPGSAPAIHTFLHRQDRERMLEAVKKAKSLADIVAVSMHWGILSPPHALVDYQIDMAHMLIDAGVDVILGTGPHQMKPVEVYKGKVVFYSLGNFAFDFGRKSGIDMEAMVPNWKENAAKMDWQLDDDWLDHFVFPPRGRKAMVGKCIIEGGEIKKFSFLPVMINKFAQPRILSATDSEFDEVLKYVQELCKAAKIDTQFIRGEDEVVIQT